MPSPPCSPGLQLLVTNAPINFLKQRIVKLHFGQFGSISSIDINTNNKSCIVTFLKPVQAFLASKRGTQWKHLKLDLTLLPAAKVKSFNTNSCDFDDELNWYAEKECEFSSKSDPLTTQEERMDQRRGCNSPKRVDDSNESQKKKYQFSEEFTAKKSADVRQEVKSRGNDDEVAGEDLLSKMATTLNSQLAILEERDKLLRIKINRDSDIKTAVVIKGLCPDMCPEKERILRDVRGIVACYESVDGSNLKMDHTKAVKDYARSSADQEEPLPHELRPEPVLSMTMDYIITQIMTKIDTGEEDNLGNWYDFCWYRLRSIRKDIIQQQLCDINTVGIVEKCARFHICCFDRLWGASKSIFDDKINSETLMNCLQSLMHMYEDLRKQGTECPNEAEFRAYLILLKLNSGFLLSEYQQYSSILQKSPQVKDAVLIHTAYSNNMYSTYFSLMKKATYLNCCLMQRFMAHLRTKALEIIVRAHCPPNKISRLPVNFIMQTLKFDSRQDCVSFCESFGLVLSDDSYNFIVSRNDFFFPDSLFIISTPSSIVVRKRVSVAEAVVGANSKLPLYIPHEVHNSFNEDGTLKLGALDATDQEEKLYRDIVERKLILKRGGMSYVKSGSSPKKEVENIIPPPSPKGITEPTRLQQKIEPPVIDLLSDEENEDSLKGETVSDEESNDELEFTEHVSEDDSITSSSSEPDIETEADSPLMSSSNSCSDSNDSTVISASPQIKQNEIPFEFNFKQPLTPIKTISVLPKSPVSPTVPNSVPAKKRKMLSPITPPTWNFIQMPQWKTEKSPPKKAKISEENVCLTKLKKIRPSEKMKKVSLRKFALLWRSKAEKLKKITDKSLRDYLFHWGTSSQCAIPKCSFRNRLLQKKKTGLVVMSILYSDIVDRIDPSTGMVGELLSNILARLAVDFAHAQGNVSQPQPVFWKLVFALPPTLVGSFTFPDKLRKWCRAAFYTNANASLGGVQYRLGSVGVPVFMSVNVLLGSKSLEEHGKNISAAIVIRANGWESKEETEQRCDKLISLTDNSFPLVVLTLGNKFESGLQLRNGGRLSFFYESLWNDTDKLINTLKCLAQNTCLQRFKIDSLRSVISLSSEKLFDALHEDRFINDGLNDVLCVPNNVIWFYNKLIQKIENEILTFYEANFYGTAYEFEQYLKKSNPVVMQFPSHYADVNFKNILRKHLRHARLPEIKWPFIDSKDLLASFRSYCHSIGCDGILSKLMRIINPPDSNDIEHPLSHHLEMISWLRIVEDLVKEIINQEQFKFNIVYRENKLSELNASHWWMSSEVVVKMLTGNFSSFS